MSGVLKTLMRAAPDSGRTKTWRGLTPLVVALYCVFAVFIYIAVFGIVVVNATDSLKAHGFFVLKYPKPMVRGAVVLIAPPERFADKFEGLQFAKRLTGLPGDVIRHEGGAVCINAACFAQAQKNGEPFGTLLPEGRIPDGAIALMGESPSSLDSRYAEVGLFTTRDVIAVGVPIPWFPHWTDLGSDGKVSQ